MSAASSHLQKLTMSGRSEEQERSLQYDYQVESNPILWKEENIQESYRFVSEISRFGLSVLLYMINFIHFF